MKKIKFTWIAGFFSNNRKLKLLSLLLGILTFYAIRGATSDETKLQIPVNVRMEEEGIAILEQDPSSVEITFRGSTEDILWLAQKHIKGEVKAVIKPKAKNPTGSEQVAINHRNITGTGGGVRVVNIAPRTVDITLDREVEKEFLVAEPETIGKPLLGKVEISYKPRTVKIYGPKRRLEEAKNVVTTEPVQIEGRVESFTEEVRVIPPIAWGSEIDPETIEVTVNIVTESVSRQWTNIAVLAMSPQGRDAEYRFDPPTVDVTVQGRKKLVQKILRKQIYVFADCTEINRQETNRAPVYVYLPQRTELRTTVKPERVRVVTIDSRDTTTNTAPETISENRRGNSDVKETAP
ncbi:MAG: CdaR family protein [Verrucomicrobiota bacterium]